MTPLSSGTFSRIVGRLAALLLFLVALVGLGACCLSLPARRGEYMREQCPESPRTYCPAQHDTTRGRR